jgi:cytochrome b involved in lipid metabolism
MYFLATTDKMDTYTRAQVAEHNSQESCWVILNGQVLDLTGFEAKHPGKLAFVRGAGTDIGELMSKIHKGTGHSANAYEWAKEFVIGDLID